MDEGEYFQNLYAYINGLDDEIRADAQTYEGRLELCRRCDLLMSGMCRACGQPSRPMPARMRNGNVKVML